MNVLIAILGAIFFWILWVISMPCTLLVIIFQLAKDNADWVYAALDSKMKKAKPTMDRVKNFENDLKQKLAAYQEFRAAENKKSNNYHEG